MTIYNYFGKDLEFINGVVRMLNESGLEGEFTYLHVELREAETHKKIGEFSDEIGPDSWYFQPINVN